MIPALRLSLTVCRATPPKYAKARTCAAIQSGSFWLRTAYKLLSRYERLRRLGMLTTREVAARFGVSRTAVQQWGRQGLITQLYQDELKRGLWQLPPDQTILKGCGGKAPRPARLVPITAQVSE